MISVGVSEGVGLSAFTATRELLADHEELLQVVGFPGVLGVAVWFEWVAALQGFGWFSSQRFVF